MSGKSPLNEWSARRKGRFLHNTQQTQVAKDYALNGIRTRVSNNQTPADAHLRPHGHWGRLSFVTKSEGKVNFTLEQATKAQRGSRDIVILFL